MSANKVIPLIALACVLSAPFWAVNRNVSISKDIVSKTLVNKEFTVKVNEITKSNNGFVTCTFYVVEINKQLLGPCTTATSNSSNGKQLSVGRTYTVKSATVDKDFIVINDATLIAGMIRRQVVRVFHIGWTRMAKLDNGDTIGGDNVAPGDWISIE